MLIRFFISIVTIVLFIGCSSYPKKIEIGDLKNIPQNPLFFVKDIDFSKKVYDSNNSNFLKQYYQVWGDKFNTSKELILWPLKSYKYGIYYGSNLQLIEKDFIIKLKKNANIKDYLTINKKALTLHYLNMRALPTSKPFFKNPKQAGEGFPFDYLQNSSIGANKPIIVTHYSKDKKWVHIWSSFTHGWVKEQDIVFVDEKYAQKRMNQQHIFFIKEGIPIYSYDKTYLFQSRIGTLLPLLEEEKLNFRVEVVSALNLNMPLYSDIKISKAIAVKKPLVFNAKNIIQIINQLKNSTYGWGGLYEQRDCSSTIRDYFNPFGIWLARNSSKQKIQGTMINLENFNDLQKIEKINSSAVAFKTLLYKNGHIMLYVGNYKDEIVIFHNMWGIKTNDHGKYGRIIIGKSIFSTLKIGKNQKFYDDKSNLLTKLRSLNTLN